MLDYLDLVVQILLDLNLWLIGWLPLKRVDLLNDIDRLIFIIDNIRFQMLFQLDLLFLLNTPQNPWLKLHRIINSLIENNRHRL